jgi:hypothetical protein
VKKSKAAGETACATNTSRLLSMVGQTVSSASVACGRFFHSFSGSGILAVLILLLCAPLFSQEDAQWRSALTELLSRPPGTATLQDLQRLEDNIRLATPYFGTLTPGDYEANRELIRRMTAYLAAMNLANRDPRMRFALRRANQALASLRYAAPPAFSAPLGPMPPADPRPAPPTRAQAPWELQAPDISNIPEADKAKARELQDRYESAAAQAATAWQSAEVLRQNLAAEGMALNTLTATSIARVQFYLETAADALREQDWEDAKVNLQRAEYETEKVFKTVGH